MRKTSMTLALALAFGAVGSVAAQQAPTQQPKAGEHRGHERRGGQQGDRRAQFRGDRAPGGFLLRGITLTDAQKAQLAQLRERNKPSEAERQQRQAQREELRALRQKGDTAALRARFEQLRARGQQERQRDVAAIRGILTAEQQKQFDANLAEAQKRQAQRGERGGRKAGR
ncbi:MAG TPA: Spy/CpxP family protein refolding chaperone [Gemmatimonadaceae bacterium]|nr:Spy/CpxP family protein refolding chaperone [Gemmatimonadaceae bacterium]